MHENDNHSHLYINIYQVIYDHIKMYVDSV